jgi:hypothetical protein
MEVFIACQHGKYHIGHADRNYGLVFLGGEFCLLRLAIQAGNSKLKTLNSKLELCF